MRSEQAVVFVHGLGDTPDSWMAQVDALPAGWRGVTARLPGLDRADEQEFSFEAATAAVVDQMRAEGVERAHLCGLSLGAMVVLRLAVTQPERVLSVTSIRSTHRRSSSAEPRTGSICAPRVASRPICRARSCISSPARGTSRMCSSHKRFRAC